MPSDEDVFKSFSIVTMNNCPQEARATPRNRVQFSLGVSGVRDRCRWERDVRIDYRCADKKVGEFRDDIGAIRWVLTPSFRKLDVHPPIKRPLSQEMHLKILHFISGLKMPGAVEKLLFTYLWNRYHQQIPGITLIQIGAISFLLCQH